MQSIVCVLFYWHMQRNVYEFCEHFLCVTLHLYLCENIHSHVNRISLNKQFCLGQKSTCKWGTAQCEYDRFSQDFDFKGNSKILKRKIHSYLERKYEFPIFSAEGNFQNESFLKSLKQNDSFSLQWNELQGFSWSFLWSWGQTREFKELRSNSWIPLLWDVDPHALNKASKASRLLAAWQGAEKSWELWLQCYKSGGQDPTRPKISDFHERQEC